MTRRFSKTFIAVSVASLLAVVFFSSWFTLRRMASGPHTKERIESAASAFLQRPLTIETIEWRYWPRLALVGRNVRLWRDPSKNQLRLESPRLEVRLPFLSLPKVAIAAGEILRGNRKFTSLHPVFAGRVHNEATEATFTLAIKENPQFTATLDLEEIRHRSTSIYNVHALIRRKGDSYLLDATEFQGLGGTVTVQGSYRPSAQHETVSLTWNAAGLQAQDLFRLAGSSADVSGVLNSTGHIQSGVGALFLPSLNGELSVNLKNGWFGKATGVLKVLTRLNVTTLLSEIKGEHQSRVPFDETRGSVKIENGLASTVEPFVLENKTLQMAFVGRYDLPTKYVHGQVAIHTLMVTDEIIDKIPIVRDILHGDKKGLTPVWVSVKGVSDHLEVKVLSGKSIASPVWNTIANTFRLPERLLRKITD